MPNKHLVALEVEAATELEARKRSLRWSTTLTLEAYHERVLLLDWPAYRVVLNESVFLRGTRVGEGFACRRVTRGRRVTS